MPRKPKSQPKSKPQPQPIQPPGPHWQGTPGGAAPGQWPGIVTNPQPPYRPGKP